MDAPDTSAEPLIVFDQVSLWVGNRLFLDDIELVIGEGETVVVGGQPGSGKSFLLRLVLGLPGMSQADGVRFSGEVVAADDRLLSGRADSLQNWRRQVGSVLWSGGLIDNMDIRRNITLPLYYHFSDMMRPEQIEARCSLLMSELEITHLDIPGLRPIATNSEERIRVALARALINQPCALLLDDPVAGMGPETAAQLLPQIFSRPSFADGIEVHARTKRPVSRLIVTNNLEAYRKWGDRFAVLEDRKVRMIEEEA